MPSAPLMTRKSSPSTLVGVGVRVRVRVRVSVGVRRRVGVGIGTRVRTRVRVRDGARARVHALDLGGCGLPVMLRPVPDARLHALRPAAALAQRSQAGGQRGRALDVELDVVRVGLLVDDEVVHLVRG